MRHHSNASMEERTAHRTSAAIVDETLDRIGPTMTHPGMLGKGLPSRKGRAADVALKSARIYTNARAKGAFLLGVADAPMITIKTNSKAWTYRVLIFL